MKLQRKLQRIGLLGGTFDPIHQGHLDMAESAYRFLCLDQVWLIPCRQAFLGKTVTASLVQRLTMLVLAMQGKPYLRLDIQEIERPGPSYTVDTLKRCSERWPNVFFTWIIGEDAYQSMPEWHAIETLPETVHFAVAPRLGYKKTKNQPFLVKLESQDRVIRLPDFHNPVSSSSLKQWFKCGRLEDDLPIPKAVLAYIKSQALYASKDALP